MRCVDEPGVREAEEGTRSNPQMRVLGGTDVVSAMPNLRFPLNP